MSKYDFLNEDVYLYFVIARILIPSVRMSDQMQLLL
jgi:predicted transporter